MKKRSLLAALLLCLTLLGGCFFGETELPPAAEYSDWNLILVDAEHSVPSDWEVTLVDLRGGEQVDRRIIDTLQAMFDACRADGLLPIVYSGYRSQETQQSIYNRNLARNLADGYSSEEAEALTRQWVALPGTSEHQLGLAVDIDSEDPDQCRDESVWAWLLEHCAEYGFILRYPDDKTDITGIGYEPWHFRYVGKAAAQTIMSEDITLEEYLSDDW
ncbi:MAG: M15 family metallopeptidase [Firmicutes bacterium]|nr:M15 family metallopeptidase [Bacillota bacterium]